MIKKNYPNQAWYVAGWSNEFNDQKPLKRKILGEEIVFFRNTNGDIVALEAMCPHRGADLSIGCIVNGNIQCPFHGWQFDSNGKCVVVPSQTSSQKIPSKAVVKSYHVIDKQGIIWIWGGDLDPDFQPPYYEFLDPDFGLGMRRVQDIPRLANGPFLSVVENAIDNTHPPFIHLGTLAGEPLIVADQVIRFDEDMRGFWGQLDPKNTVHDSVEGTEGILGISRRLMNITKLNREESYFRFDLGGVVYFYDKFLSGHEQVALFMATPADDTHTWFFGEHIRSFAKNTLVDFMIKKWAKKLNDEDMEHVELMLSSKKIHGIDNPVSVVADRPALAFRKIFFKNLNQENRDSFSLQNSNDFIES